MRMRKKKHGEERLEAVSDLFTLKMPEDPSRELRVEIGCGKGRFIVENALKYPETDFLAVEKVRDVVMLAAEKAKAAGVSNLRFAMCDAKDLLEITGGRRAKILYLNFSDPWPKARHYKRRLTYREFLSLYERLLEKDGILCFKTDNRPLFDFSVNELEESGWKVENVTYDLHNSEYAGENIMTEYETAFSEKGIKINRLEALPPLRNGK